MVWEHASGPLATLPGEMFVCEAKGLARRGSDRIIVIRLDPEIDIVPHHFSQHGRDSAMSMDHWSQQLDAPLLINAGMYTADLRHMGALKAHGEWLAGDLQSQWQGWLVGDAPALLVDTAQQPNHPRLATAPHKLQSMMLLDQGGRIRTRISSRTASRTVVAQDRRGRILVLMTEGAVSLADLALWLHQSPLEVELAINLDGGFESQLALSTPEGVLSHRGRYGTRMTGMPSPRLPAVLAFSRSAKATDSSR